MERVRLNGRNNWEQIVEAQGFLYHSIGGPYWCEQTGYHLSQAEALELEEATNELHRLCLIAVEYVIANNLLNLFAIPERFHDLIKSSWRNKLPSIYGRFDLRYDGNSPPKMYEYNADTPTSLLEAGRIQSNWQLELFSTSGQFNKIEERLLDAWRIIGRNYSNIHFSSVCGHTEDQGNAEYMRSLAARAGITTKFIHVEEIRFDEDKKRFVDGGGASIETWFKLYPWEWILEDSYADHLLSTPITMIEPAWKMILSSKAILPILWQLFPEHPNLLPAYFEESHFSGSYVRKPIYGREGSNIAIQDGTFTRYVPGPYGELPSVFQSYCPLPQFCQLYTLIGSWVIGGKAAGIGIRESDSIISENGSRFVPHYVQ